MLMKMVQWEWRVVVAVVVDAPLKHDVCLSRCHEACREFVGPVTSGVRLLGDCASPDLPKQQVPKTTWTGGPLVPHA